MKLAELQAELPTGEFPWIKEYLVRPDGEVDKVILDYTAFRALLDELEDRGLSRAMAQAVDEVPIPREEALRQIEAY
jgi:hypothetical protein